MANGKIGKSGSNLFWIFIKIFFSLGAIGWFASTVKWSDVIDKFSQINFLLLVIAFLVYLIRLIPCALRWVVVGKISGYILSFGESFYGYMIGGFFNTFLPTGRGGDAIRAIVIAQKRKFSLGGIMGTILVERFSGMFVTVIIALSACFVASSSIPMLRDALPSVIILSILLVIFGIVVLSPQFFKLYLKIVKKLPFQKFWNSITDLMQVFQVSRKYPKDFFLVSVYSFFNQAIFIFTGFIIAKAIWGFNAPWYSFPIVIPMIFVAELLPSIGGYGIREAGYVVFFAWFGVDKEHAVVFGIIQLVFLWISALMGAVFFILGSPEDKNRIRELEIDTIEKNKLDTAVM